MQNPATAGKCGLSLSFIFQDQLNMLAQFWDILLYSVPTLLPRQCRNNHVSEHS